MPSPKDTVVTWLQHAENVLIITHREPDGDTIGSSLALKMALEKLGKSVCIVSKDAVPKPFLFLPKVETIKHDFLLGDWDVIVIMDCGDLKRTGFVDRVRDFALRKKRLINIDHHPKNDLHKISNVTLFDTTAAAAGEIVAEIISDLRVSLDKDIATCLLTAIYTDTGGFKHSNTSKRTLELASQLMASGARLKKITQSISNAKTVQSLRLWGTVLSRIRRHPEYNLISAIITQKDLKECNASLADLDGAVNLIGSVPDMKAAILLTELPDGHIKASLRTESDEVDVSRIAQIFGGGGHKKASGFIIPGRVFKDRSGWRIITT